MLKKQGVLLLVAILTILASESHGAETVDPRLPALRIVFFTPKNVEVPEGVQRRLTQIAKYTESFFVKWMTHWGYEPARKQIFQWKADGDVEVLFAKGDRNAHEYPDGSFRPQMMQDLAKKHQFPQNGNINWIFVYLGESHEFNNYRGAGNSKAGGWAILNYIAAPGEVRADVELAEGFHQDITLKGAIHELGHAFGLPHIGPRMKRNLGNSLMGPVTRIWEKQVGPKDRRAYLTEANAAFLWKHPLFTGTTKDRGDMPQVKLTDYEAIHQKDSNTFEIQGTVTSNRSVHSVIVVDDMDDKPGEYWVRAYVGRVDDKGRWTVSVNEPVPCGGKLRIAFCFDNGIITGDGEKHGLYGALERPYRYVRQTYQFD